MGVSDYGELFVAATSPNEAPARVGSVYLNTTDNKFYKCTAISPYTWSEVSAGGGGGALTFAGSSVSEATTTSTTDVSLVTIGSLSIAATSPILAFWNFRGSVGVYLVYLGIKLNTTELLNTSQVSSTLDAIQNGYFEVLIGPAATNYQSSYMPQFVNAWYDAKLLKGIGAQRPLTAVTDFIILGRTSDAAITLGVCQVYIYTYATS